MATAEELLAEETGEVLTIDLSTRVITIPASIKHLGVESDDDVKRLYFSMPRMYGETDLSEFEVRVNYLNANGDGDVYPVDDVTIGDDALEFSWLVGRFALAYKGNVSFIVCLKKLATTEDGEIIVEKEFNTTVATLPVLVGLETTEAVIQQNPDVLENILKKLEGLEHPITYIESLVSEEKIALRSLESGMYILYGHFTSYEGGSHVLSFGSKMLVSVVRRDAISYVQIFYSKDNTVQYLEITDDSYTRKDTKLTNMESVANKVTEIDETADDDHYPSAKAVWDAVKNASLTGADGKSAYEIAVDNGFEGTEAEWLESLHGKDGTVTDGSITEEMLAPEVADKLNNGTEGVAVQNTRLYTFNDAYVNWCSGQAFPILFCGDSTIAGFGVSHDKEKAWVGRLEAKLKYECNNQSIKLYNVAVSGSTTPNASQFDTWFGTDGAYADTKMVGIGWAINDRLSASSRKEYYESQFNKVEILILKAFQYGIQPFILTSQATLESGVATQYSGYKLRTASDINICANNARRDLAKKYNLEIIDMEEFTNIYLKNSLVPIDTIIPDRLHFGAEGNLFEGGVAFSHFVNRTVVVGNRDRVALSYADQRITNCVPEDYISYGGDLKVYVNRDGYGADKKIFDAYVFVKDMPAAITAIKMNLNSDTYIKIDQEMIGSTATVELVDLRTELENLDLGLHHFEVYTGNSGIADFAGFVINETAYVQQDTSVQSIRFSSNIYTTGENQPVQTTIIFSPNNAANKNVTYSATGGAISATGLFTATTAGEYTITATSEDGCKTATCSVLVTNSALLFDTTDKYSANAIADNADGIVPCSITFGFDVETRTSSLDNTIITKLVLPIEVGGTFTIGKVALSEYNTGTLTPIGATQYSVGTDGVFNLNDLVINAGETLIIGAVGDTAQFGFVSGYHTDVDGKLITSSAFKFGEAQTIVIPCQIYGYRNN